MSATQVLLLGGHGRIALQITPLLLARKWNVTSVVRNAEHIKEISDLGKNQPGHLHVMLSSLEEVKETADAAKVLEEVNPDIVIWAAGAGGKGGSARTYAIDRDAAKYYIIASLARPSIRKFLMISYISSRHGRPSWWSDEDYRYAQRTNHEVLPDYFQAKVAADEHLVAEAHKRAAQGDTAFQAICLRPGTLSDEIATGKVSLGKIGTIGNVPRADVASVTAALLDRNDTRGWYDLLKGDTPIEEAISALVKEKHDGLDGEDLGRILAA